MNLGSSDLGVLGNLAEALGLFSGGAPNPGWFGEPERFLKQVLANPAQRAALIAFVDEALGGADRSTTAGVVWLPIVGIDRPDAVVSLAVTIDESRPEGLHIGIGLKFETPAPASTTTLAVPLFLVAKEGGPPVTQPLLLGQVAGRIRIGTSITLDAAAPVAGQARLGGIGLDVDLPTAAGADPVFALALSGLMLPGATAPRDVRVAADGAGELDDALLDLVLSLVKTAGDDAADGSAIASLGGLLGLRGGDAVLDFPITQLPTRGVRAIADWLLAIVQDTAARTDWLAHIGRLIGGTPVGTEVRFVLGPAALALSLQVDEGPSGHVRLTPRLALQVGDDDRRVAAVADLLRIDLVTGEATALPSLGLWAAMGHAGAPVLDLAAAPPLPATRADVLRLGFALDGARRLQFVLAADNVVIGSNTYPTLDLTSPDAVMDAAGGAVSEIAESLLAELGAALPAARRLLGLDPPAGIAAVTLTALMADPLAAVAGYWQQVVADAAAAADVLETLRAALFDAGTPGAVSGLGTPAEPWRLPLIGPLALEAHVEGAVVTLAAAVGTSIGTLGQGCTVVATRIGVTLARIDLAARTAALLPGAEASITARERGVSPPQVRLAVGDFTELMADHVGLRLAWSPSGTAGSGAQVSGQLSAQVSAPNPRRAIEGTTLPLQLPTIAADGSVTLPPAAWDAVQLLVGHLASLAGGGAGAPQTFLGDVVAALGWDVPPRTAGGGIDESRVALRLADLVLDPGAALTAWLARVAVSPAGPRVLSLLADLLGGSGNKRAGLLGRGHPDDPFRIVLGENLPELVAWIAPGGPAPLLLAAPDALRQWRPGQLPLGFDVLENALWAEAGVAPDLADLLVGRALESGAAGRIAAGLVALAQRWVGGDGRIVPPAADVAGSSGIDVRHTGLAAGQLWPRLDIEDLTGRVPTTTVHVALGAGVWPDAPEGRVVHLAIAGLEPAMLALPAAAAGEWFVELGTRADCLLPTSGASDGTPEQAARLARWLGELGAASSDIALIAVAGAGHAARIAANEVAAVTDLVLLGTPFASVSLTALQTQPAADALRLLHRLMPAALTPAEAADPATEPEDADLALGRALVAAMMDIADLADPAAELRPAALEAPAPRTGLAVTALFGAVSADQVERAITAITAAGLAERAQARVAAAEAAATVPPAPAGEALPDLRTGLRAGLRLGVPTRPGGALAIAGRAELSLFAADLGPAGFVQRERVLRVRLSVADRTGWLSATPTLGLRAVSADLIVPLDGAASGSCRITLHDARVFGQDWECLVLGSGAGMSAVLPVLPVLPEARVLLSAFVQRLVADVAGASSVALADVLHGLGLIAEAGGVAADAVDQLVHDPGGLVRQRFAAQGPELADALRALLGPLGAAIDFDARSVRISGGGSAAGRFGWSVDATAATTGLAGSFTIGPDAALPLVGGLQLRLALQPFGAQLVWHHGGGGSDTATLWPAPEGAALARMLAHAAPGLGAQAALELLRGADETARPVIDALLDALGFLADAAGAADDAQRALRPLAGVLRDPVGWLGSAGSLASSPVKLQALLDALRPLMDLPGAAGEALPLANGVTLAVTGEAAGARLALTVDPGAWVAPGGVAARLAGGITASLGLAPSAPPSPALAVHLGLPGAVGGRQAVHAQIGASGLSVFLRPSSGPDISLVPFAGLGSLSAIAQAALPFLLDRLAALAAPVGPLVAKLGDALALRSGAPAAFDGAALQAWAANPVGRLRDAAPTIIAQGVQALADLLDDVLPAGLTAGHDGDVLEVSVGAFTLGWAPLVREVSLEATGLVVPGIEHLSFKLAINDEGLRELSASAGPAAIDAAGVLLRPFVSIAAGEEPADGRRVLIGMAAGASSHFALRWLLDAGTVELVASSDAADLAASYSNDPAQVALRIVEVLVDVVAAIALAQQAVRDLLQLEVATGNRVRHLLEGVLLAVSASPADPPALIAQPFDPSTLLARVRQLIVNIAGAGIVIPLPEGLTLSFLERDARLGVLLGLEPLKRFTLVPGDVNLSLEVDASWISGPIGAGGLFVGFMPSAGTAFAPSLAVDGVGLRVAKSSGPLIDAGLSIESVALHVFAAVGGATGTSGGVQLQFSNLAVSAASSGGNNGIAQGIMRDTGPTPPRPAFSPALAVQKHGNAAVSVSLRAGDPPGPWWIAIQRGFGPLYLEQVGFDARLLGGRIERISLLMDGSVSMFGLTCAVDDLQITYFTADGDFFDAGNWKVDLAGLAVAANMAGVTIAGGLLKQVTNAGQANESIEYLGMLLGRFAVYGLTIYGGYGEGVDAQGQKFTAFFAVGAVNGPIGGPPAFFLTGIGGGFGINRKLVVPTDLSNFGDYPLIQALDIAATPAEPMQQLRALGAYFPMNRGTFWFAAGLSFNSFALVDGIAVVGVQIGDGLDINLLGLARMALPRPQVALVSIELALLARFSSSEGVLWVQGQLTDNSWLLYPDIKLTGGFAYVLWFKGENAGEFVLTMGGYHPDFHRAGYPQVPRLGLHWSIGSNIVIEAGSYFALTSEALMAGGDFIGSASFGPAWAEVRFGAHGIVFFDPFSYQVNVYARIAAGVTIDTWLFGEITISVHVGARIDVRGPEFRGSVTFDVGPIELTFDFGGSDKADIQPIGASTFIGKYLEPSAGNANAALAHALMTASGALPAKGESATPDGTSARPFVVVVEFSLTFTSTVPAVHVMRTNAGAAAFSTHAPSAALAVAPMQQGPVEPTITITWVRSGVAQPFPFKAIPRPFGRFPLGIWGPAGDPNNRKVPKADMVEALNELDLVCEATPSGGGAEIPYHQVEIGPRKPLPFSRRPEAMSELRTTARSVAELVGEPATVDAAFGTAERFLRRTTSPTTLAALRGERQAPPRPGTLAEGLESATRGVKPATAERPGPKVYDHFIDAPLAVGLLSGAALAPRAAERARTTVAGSARAWRVSPPTLAKVTAERSRSIAARLVIGDRAAPETAGRQKGTVIGAGEVPPTAQAHAPTAVVARSGAPLAEALAGFNAGLTKGGGVDGRGRPLSLNSLKGKAAANAGAVLGAGQTAVLALPNARADAPPDAARPRLAVLGAPARVLLLGIGGRLLGDQRVGPGEALAQLDIPRGTERIVAMGLGLSAEANAAPSARLAAPSAGLDGWHAGSLMPYVGHGNAVGAGCLVHSTTDQLRLHRERADAGWVSGAELARGITTVSTTFAQPLRCVLIVLDDPAVTGADIDGRSLLMGLDGATRALDAAGGERAPVLLSLDNRSVLAYDIVPGVEGGGEAGRAPAPVVIGIASQQGWSLVGVMGAVALDARAAIALVAARGLDAALRPLTPRTGADAAAAPGVASRLVWLGPQRDKGERLAARALARGQAEPAAPRATGRSTARATGRSTPGVAGGSASSATGRSAPGATRRSTPSAGSRRSTRGGR
ncbi:MAG: hypothetical protein HZC37_28825 [Burkholderiales bacterium]|nr:hypothetical protein [Burkholderiales bacterium]